MRFFRRVNVDTDDDELMLEIFDYPGNVYRAQLKKIISQKPMSLGELTETKIQMMRSIFVAMNEFMSCEFFLDSFQH